MGLKSGLPSRGAQLLGRKGATKTDVTTDSNLVSAFTEDHTDASDSTSALHDVENKTLSLDADKEESQKPTSGAQTTLGASTPTAETSTWTTAESDAPDVLVSSERSPGNSAELESEPSVTVTPAVHESPAGAWPPLGNKKIMKLASGVDNSQRGCFSSSGTRQVPSPTTLSADCRRRNNVVVPVAPGASGMMMTLLSAISPRRGSVETVGNPALESDSDMTALADGRSSLGAGNLHGGVNVLLGGAMLSGLILLVFFICYCCQRTARKHEQTSRPIYWIQDPEAQIDVLILEEQRQERPGCVIGADSVDDLLQTITPSPPPPYDAVVINKSEAACAHAQTSGIEPPPPLPTPAAARAPVAVPPYHGDISAADVSDGLPTYEAALKLAAQRRA